MEDTKDNEVVTITWLALTQQTFKHGQAYLSVCPHVVKSLLTTALQENRNRMKLVMPFSHAQGVSR